MTRLTTAVLIVLTAGPAFVQGRIGGAGEVSPTTAATFEGSEGKLILLVLWRGQPGWWQARSTSMGAGSYPMRKHFVTVRGQQLELQVDENNVAHIQEQTIPLQGVNVLLLDSVDREQVRIAGTLLVDAPFPAQLPFTGDPIHAIIERSMLLGDFVK